MSLSWPRGGEKQAVYKSQHFWYITIIFLILAFIYYGYYSNIPLFDRWFSWFWHVIIFEFNFHTHGSLFLVPCIYAALAFWLRGVLIAWFFSMGIMLPRIIDFLSNQPAALLSNILFLSVPLMIIAFLSFEIKLRERERRTLLEREAERQFYMSQVFKAQEDERQRIARELHDGTTQNLLVVANRAQSLLAEDNLKDVEQVKAQAERIRDEVLDLSEDVRRLSLDLRPAVLDNIGLTPAIRWLVDRFSKENNTKAKLVVDGEVRKLSAGSDVIIFRIIQEALNNIRRHSKATKAVVTIEFLQEEVKIAVQDNGKGFLLPKTINKLATEGKLGIIGMQQRASFLDGIINISSKPGKGTLVLAKLIT